MAEEHMMLPTGTDGSVQIFEEVDPNQLELPLSIEQRLTRLERRRDAHYRTTLNVQEEVGNIRYEVQEMLAIFKSIKNLLKFLVVAGKILKWVAGVGVALYTLKALLTGNFKPNFWE